MKIIEFFKKLASGKTQKKTCEVHNEVPCAIEPEPAVEPEQSTTKEDPSTIEVEHSSLLDNKEFMTLVEQCCGMYEELDRMQEQIKDANVQEFITMQKSRIKESLILSGASIIDGDTEFSLLRHTPVPMAVTKNGTPIEETIETGVEIEDRVLIKAKVSLE